MGDGGEEALLERLDLGEAPAHGLDLPGEVAHLGGAAHLGGRVELALAEALRLRGDGRERLGDGARDPVTVRAIRCARSAATTQAAMEMARPFESAEALAPRASSSLTRTRAWSSPMRRTHASVSCSSRRTRSCWTSGSVRWPQVPPSSAPCASWRWPSIDGSIGSEGSKAGSPTSAFSAAIRVRRIGATSSQGAPREHASWPRRMASPIAQAAWWSAASRRSSSVSSLKRFCSDEVIWASDPRTTPRATSITSTGAV
ncbi:hypothetical protein BE04_43490 [Sorangium cellulosum]|uniref:Uncharacterized protein n=1 Tax=Sorangium cellulosum TaxID=56 RepID=A0A150PYC2_SORCE|nr:hypothetical protein BE04_43490 [Sorangium cellulosum]